MTRPDVRLDRIGIVMMSAIGDAVHVLPVVTALKRHRPTSRITWVLQPGPAALVRGHPDVDEIVVFDRKRGRRAFLDVREALRERPLDLVLALQTYFKAGLVTSFARAPVKLGFDRARSRDLSWLFSTHRIPSRPTAHMQDEYFEFLEYLGVPHEPVEWKLGPWPQERDAQRALLARFDRPLAALVVGSSKPEKDWPAERWAAVADALYADHGLQPVLVGGRSPREAEMERVIMERARHRPVSLLDSGLRPLVGILDAAALVVSLDTGPLHMAVALDRPVVSLVGYTDPRRTGPYRRFQDLAIDAFHDPGEDGPISRATRTGRMARISVRDVLERVELWSARYRAPARTA
ncbi:MAG TPA: glycosyltransferase family 9 protein [Gemmatimonadaceae bacterium]|nr:glycosyltransferase family 9 protein [Gemmatimonadaceae bacterium]